MAWEEWRSPIQEGHWTDQDGRRWTRRGRGGIGPKAARRLLARSDVRVHLLYLWYEDRDIPVAERQQFWEQVEPYLEGKAGSRGDLTEFTAAEFRSDDGHTLLLFEKEC